MEVQGNEVGVKCHSTIEVRPLLSESIWLKDPLTDSVSNKTWFIEVKNVFFIKSSNKYTLILCNCDWKVFVTANS